MGCERPQPCAGVIASDRSVRARSASPAAASYGLWPPASLATSRGEANGFDVTASSRYAFPANYDSH
jgi:hypothetical protein